MHEAATAVLAAWHGVRPEARAEVLSWYDREHHLERLGVPGFLSARRYVAVEGAPELFVCYETTGLDVLSSEPYLARLNAPTEWTTRCQGQVRDFSRAVCRIARRTGRATGGAVATFRFADGAERLDEDWWRAFEDRALLPPGIISAELWLADRERSSIPSREKERRGSADASFAAAIVLHAAGIAEARRAAEEAAGALASAPGAQAGLYRLQFAIQST